MEPSRERFWAVVSHSGSILSWAVMWYLTILMWENPSPVILFMRILPTAAIIPFLVWIFKGKENNFVGGQAKESLNFQISFYLYSIFIFIFLILLKYLIIFLWNIINPAILNHEDNKSLIGYFLFGVFGFGSFRLFMVVNLIFSIIGSINAFKSTMYMYPINLRLIK